MTIAEKVRRAKADYDEVYDAGKASVLFEVHKITVGDDLVSGIHTLLKENQFVKDNLFNADGTLATGFIVQLINLHTAPQGTSQVGYGYGGNIGLLPSGDTFTYGYALYRTATGSPAIYHKYTKVNTHSSGGVPYVTDDGSVCVVGDAKAVITQGDYLLILSVAPGCDHEHEVVM